MSPLIFAVVIHPDVSFLTNFILNWTISSLVSGVVILIYPCFHNYIPSMLKRIGLGILFALFTTIYYVFIFACKEHFHLDTSLTKAHDYVWNIVWNSLYTVLPYIFILHNSLTSSWNENKGLMIGLWYAAYGLGMLMISIEKYISI